MRKLSVFCLGSLSFNIRGICTRARNLLRVVFQTTVVLAFSLYLDPALGSMIIQILIGALAGVLVAIKILWSRIKMWVKHHFLTRSIGQK